MSKVKRIQEDKQRSEIIYYMRRQGKNYKELAKLFGISPTRAKQVYYRAQARKIEQGLNN